MKLKFFYRFLTLVALLFSTASLDAGIHYWTGGGGNTLWSNPANWDFGNPPVAGEADIIVTFTSIGTPNSTMDIAGLTLKELNFWRTNVTLNSSGPMLLGLNNATVTVDAAQAASITLGANLQLVLSGQCTFVVKGIINNGPVGPDYFSGGELTFLSRISGLGSVVFDGVGGFTLAGSQGNTYLGTTTVKKDSRVRLGKSSGFAIPGNLYIGGQWHYVQLPVGAPLLSRDGGIVQWIADHQMSSTATITNSGYITLGNHYQTFGPLRFEGGALSTTNGLATLGADVFASGGNESFIGGRLALGVPDSPSAGRTFTVTGNGELAIEATISGTQALLRKKGSGELHLKGTNAYTTFTLVQEGTLAAFADYALGTLGTPTHVGALATLELHSVNLQESLEFTGPGATNKPGALVAASGFSELSGPISILSSITVATLTGYYPSPQPGLPGSSWTTYLDLSGVISGAGSLIKTGGGKMDISGATDNTFTGGLHMRQGHVRFVKTGGKLAVPGTLVIGNGTQTNLVESYLGYQVGDASGVFVAPKSKWFVYAGDNIGSLTMSGGEINMTAGPLTLGGNLTLSCPSNEVPRIAGGGLDLGGASRTFIVSDSGKPVDAIIDSPISGAAGITKTGAGRLALGGLNTFTGAFSVSAGSVEARHARAFGTSGGGVTVATNATLALADGVVVASESLTLNGTLSAFDCTNSWMGNVLLGTQSRIDTVADALTTLGGSVSGSGALYKYGIGTLLFAGSTANTYFGGTFVHSGRLDLAKTNAMAVPPGAFTIDGEVRLLIANQIADTTAVTVRNGGLLNLNGLSDRIGSLAGYGQVSTGIGLLTVGDNHLDSTFGGLLGGSGFTTLVKDGLGTMTFTGTNYSLGKTLLNGGVLVVHGYMEGAVLPKTSAVLAGNGAVGNIFCTNATISPGVGPGLLSSRSLALNAGSAFRCELNGVTPGVNCDQLAVTGTVNLGGATLDVSLGFGGAISNQFVLIANDGADAVTGTFAGLPEGAIFPLKGAQFRITYMGGAGSNDVVLTQITPVQAPNVEGITKLENGGIQISGTGIPGATYEVHATFNLVPAAWASLGVITADAQTGLMQFIDADAQYIPMRFYRFVLP